MSINIRGYEFLSFLWNGTTSIHVAIDQNMNRYQRKLTFLAGLVFLTGCSDPDPIPIGFIADLEGRSSDLGIASRNAVQMAVDERNAAGGINGRQIKLLIRDDHRSIDGGAKAALSLVEDNVAAIIGPILSVVAGGVVPVINDAEVVTVSPTVVSASFVGKDDYFFRLNSSSAQTSADYARIYSQAGYRTIATATDAHNDVFTAHWLQLFRAEFAKLGGRISHEAPFDSARETGLREVVLSLLQSRPQAILILANGIDTAQFSQQVRQLDENITLLATSWAASDTLITLGGRAVDGILLADTFDRDDESERYGYFRDAYQQRFRTSPTHSSVASYDAASTIFAALDESGGEVGAELKAAMLRRAGFSGLQQKISFDRFGDNRRVSTALIVKGGRFVSRQ